MIRWTRRGGYEVSTQGDKRFSAFNAIMPDGRSIEAHYQCDVKGYDPGGSDWRKGKGKPPVEKMAQEELYQRYLSLWKVWAGNNKEFMWDLRWEVNQAGWVISDRFASTDINQARALADILNHTSRPLAVRTGHMNVGRKFRPDQVLDVTVKSGSGTGKVFAPTWNMVMGYKSGDLSQVGYTEAYKRLMRRSYKQHREAWDDLLNRNEVLLLCYCKAGDFCHRLLLAEILVRGWGVTYYGEVR